MSKKDFEHYYDNIKCPINKIILMESIISMNKNLETFLYRYKGHDNAKEYILLLTKDKECEIYYGLTIMSYIFLSHESFVFLSDIDNDKIIDKYPPYYFENYKIDKYEHIAQYKNVIMKVKSLMENNKETFPYKSIKLYCNELDKKTILLFTSDNTISEFVFNIHTEAYTFNIAKHLDYPDLKNRISNKIELNYFNENFNILNDI